MPDRKDDRAKRPDPYSRYIANRAEGWLWTFILVGGVMLIILFLQAIGVLR